MNGFLRRFKDLDLEDKKGVIEFIVVFMLILLIVMFLFFGIVFANTFSAPA